MLFTDGPGIEATLEQKEKEPVPGPSVTAQAMDIDMPIRDDGFGGHLGQDIICKQLTLIYAIEMIIIFITSFISLFSWWVV